MGRKKILIVDDEEQAIDIVKEFLIFMDFEVVSARSGIEALNLLRDLRAEDLPDLVLMDIKMPGMDGLKVCHLLKCDMKTKHIPILMLTSNDSVGVRVESLECADGFLSKAVENSELLAQIYALLRRFEKKPFEPVDESLLNIYCRPDSKIHIQCSGNINVIDTSTKPLELDIDMYSRFADGLPGHGNEWRLHAKRIGTDLVDTVISMHPRINRVYNQVIGAAPDNRELHFKILSNRDFLRVPIECLFAEDDYLCLRHPLVRIIEGVVIRKQPISPSFFNRLHSENKPLNILLIAANTVPPIAGVDQEVTALESSIRDAFTSKAMRIEINVITGSDATYDNVRREIQNSSYHIVHYCGHGSYDAQSTEKSCLYLWEDTRENKTKPLSAAELKSIVEGSDIRFFYLSCCLGMTTGAQRQLLDDDFLGIADALIQAGIPSVLGFRWPVADQGAVQLAVGFYDALARDGRLDTALFEARRAMDRDDLTWLSPVLIAQK